MIDWDAAVIGPCIAVFGEEQKPTYTPPGGGAPMLIDGVFDDAYTALSLNADGEPEIASIEPVIGVRLSSFAVPPAQGGRIYLPRVETTFAVIDVRPDGKGWAKLVLNVAAG